MIPPKFLCDLIRWKECRETALQIQSLIVFLPNGSKGDGAVYDPQTAERICSVSELIEQRVKKISGRILGTDHRFTPL